MFEKSYELPLSIDYVRHWGMAEAIREIIQNALDSQSPFEWDIDNDTLIIKSKYAKLEPSSLLLGTTTKAEDKDAIGSFGEGYKIALLVLTRLNYKVTIYNNEYIWTPEFRMSKKFEAQTLWVISTNNHEQKEGVTFKVSGLTEDDIDQIKDSCLYMQKHIGQVKETSKGLILLEKPNTLFIGGLFICKTELNYGYDIKPEFLKLERDRQTVATFDLKWLVKDMWFELDDYDLVVNLMEENCPDLEHADYGAPELVKEACYKKFKSRYGEKALIAKSQEEMEKMVDAGLQNVIIIGNSGYSRAISSSRIYKKQKVSVETALSVTNILEQWLKSNKRHMRRHAKVNFNQLIEQSAKWRMK